MKVAGRITTAVFLILAIAGAATAAASVSFASSVELEDRNGRLLHSFPSADGYYSVPVPLSGVSPWLILATVAVEDKRFFNHGGVDAVAVARAVWQNAKAGGRVSGASTITQQLAKAFSPREKTVSGKLREMFAAVSLERKMSKQEILQSYFNGISYGNRAKGAEAASRIYFGIPCADMTLAQAAMLAGIPKSPKKYDPLRNFPSVQTRQKLVLERMLAEGFISRELFDYASGEKIVIRAASAPFDAPHFVMRLASRRLLPEAGGRVRLSLDAGLQQELAEMLAVRVRKLGGKNVTNAALVALDNRSGEVLAWVGSANFYDGTSGQVDGVTALRQPGSALKPFVYAMGLVFGMKASDLLDDSPAMFKGGFMPKNYDEKYHGKVPLREALACSYNIPAVRVADRLGPEKVLSGLHKFGFAALTDTAEHYGVGISLGNGEVTLLELASAYAALARGGIYIPVRYFAGRDPVSEPVRVVDPDTAYIITDILSDNGARTEAFSMDSPFSLPFPFAAKTGTSKDYRDNWAIGYTPEWTVGVWAGNFDGSPMRRVSGITGAGPILRDAAIAMHKRFPSGEFRRPSGIREARICPESGMLAGPNCRNHVREIYSASNMPGRTCPVHSVDAPGIRGKKLAVEFPKEGDVFKINPSVSSSAQTIKFHSSSDGDVRWFVDGSSVGSDWWQLKAGKHKVYCESGAGRSAAVSFKVLP